MKQARNPLSRTPRCTKDFSSPKEIVLCASGLERKRSYKKSTRESAWERKGEARLLTPHCLELHIQTPGHGFTEGLGRFWSMMGKD